MYAVPVNVGAAGLEFETSVFHPVKASASARAKPKANSFSFFIFSSLDFYIKKGRKFRSLESTSFGLRFVYVRENIIALCSCVHIAQTVLFVNGMP